MKRVKPNGTTETKVLNYCNRLRAMQGLRPVKTLALGVVGHCNKCVIARTAGVTAERGYCEVGLDEVKNPKYIRDFIKAFDRCAYPHLVDDGK